MNPLDAYQPGDLVTPADWAYIASGGQWGCLPYCDVINRELVEIMAAHSRGESRFLLLIAPPQHGKTTLVGHDFPDTWLGYLPDDEIILASYESETAEDRSKVARDDFDQFGPHIFGLSVDPTSTAASNWSVRGRRGGMIARGVGGAITGNPCSLFIIDDPIKDAKDVRSETFREDQWEWFNKVAMRRMRRGSCMVMIYTPWHEDDLGQRIIRASVRGELPPWKILRFPAISETQEERDGWASELGLPTGQPDPIGRPPGHALWPRMHTLESLLLWKKIDPYGFEALGQGRPRPKGGFIFNRKWFHKCRAEDVPRDSERCRFWDKAGKQGAGDWTAGVRMARWQSPITGEIRYYVENVVRDQLSANARDQKILSTCQEDRSQVANYRVRGDQDPAQAGKSDAEAFCRLLDGFDVKTKPITGDKVYNARPFASSVEGGNVWIVEAPWNEAYLNELEGFDKAKWDDQVDASAGAFNELSGKSNTIHRAASPIAGYTGISCRPKPSKRQLARSRSEW